MSYDQLSHLLNSYTELCQLMNIPLDSQTENEEDRSEVNHNIHKTTLFPYFISFSQGKHLPKAVLYRSGSIHLIENLMLRAIENWCCISFKIIPIDVELIKKDTPRTILYCVAAISIVTTASSSNDSGSTDPVIEDFKKDIAYYFYQQARRYLDEVLFPDDYIQDTEQSVILSIQSHFCLSYVSNLLRLPNEHRTWHYLACHTLESKTPLLSTQEITPRLVECWYRWYYIDAWIALSLERVCLLPDKLPFEMLKPAKCVFKSNSPARIHTSCCAMSKETIYNFVIMTQYMRGFIRIIRAGTLIEFYEKVNKETEAWWDQIVASNSNQIHLALCYHSMRLILVYYLMQTISKHPKMRIDKGLLVTGLDITLEILQLLNELKAMQCDQSTYYYMFFAIHKTLLYILHHIKSNREFSHLKSFAQQLSAMNLYILEGTNGYKHNIYAMKAMGQNMENDLKAYSVLEYSVRDHNQHTMHVFRKLDPKKGKRKRVSA
ncbi:hypothetical protein BDB01DRAFT_773970 [Pilobolus umbonatus]|nr:hypothetical protein BDB01DRAFT_773970 [Pilobolus umbonatus]